MPKVRVRLIVLGWAALAATLVAVPALATQRVKIDSKVTISSHRPAFHGHVRSDNDACESGRRVKLFKQRPGANKLLGKDRTNEHGRWVVRVQPLKSGAYRAKVVRRAEGTAGTIFICRGDRSQTVVVD
jgi:hypothetical protein